MRELPFATISLNELSTLPPAQTLVLTVNNRLARTLTAELAKQVTEGASELVRIEPWSTWLTNQVIERLYAGSDEGFSQVLDTQTARLVWADSIAAYESDRSLIDIDQASAIAADADSLMRNWHIHVPAALHTPDHERFLRWRQTYEARLSALDAIDVARVPQYVAQWIRAGELILPDTVVLMGFADLSAAMRGVLDATQAVGVQIKQLGLLQSEAGSKIGKMSVPTRQQQWATAIGWACSQLKANPAGRYAIVAPSLQSEATEARRLLSHLLDGMPYNVAVAAPLSQWPLGRAMLGWLKLVIEFGNQGEVKPSVAGEALLAGGCAGATTEAGARALLDARWRHRQCLVLTRAQWQDDISALPVLCQAWQAAMQVWQEIANKSLSWLDWTNGFRRVLASLGFPGEGTQTSTQYQATAALDQLMSSLAVLDDCMAPTDAHGAWQMLARLARQALFQPQRDPNARLDVLGLLEAEGGRWDGVWVMDMTDDVLPAVVSPNPLIPVQALAQAGAPRSTAQRELDWARELMRALKCAGDEVIFSWAEREGEQPNRPSPFLAELPSREWMPDAVDLPAPLALETWVDEPAMAVAANEVILGGVTVLQTQAANPMWAFFQHRLNVRGLPAHADWPATFERGNFLHRVLQLLWQRWGDQSRMLEQINSPGWDDELGSLIDRVAADKLSQWPHALRELEKQRGFMVISDWLALEAARSPFKVIEREGDHQFVQAGLSLRLTIDRIDELPNGQRVVLDYKSGSSLPQPAKDWQSMALQNAQLLVYASVLMAEGRKPDGLGWAWLNAAGVEVRGLSGDTLDLPGFELLGEQKWAQLDWDEQLEHWDARVRQLASEFAAGMHDNRFWQKADMDYCSIKPLLRLHAEPDDE